MCNISNFVQISSVLAQKSTAPTRLLLSSCPGKRPVVSHRAKCRHYRWSVHLDGTAHDATDCWLGQFHVFSSQSVDCLWFTRLNQSMVRQVCWWYTQRLTPGLGAPSCWPQASMSSPQGHRHLVPGTQPLLLQLTHHPYTASRVRHWAGYRIVIIIIC